jgi:predicted 2-oxoglutarate/Fe(II)-dependent dioxygenase YbiX
MKIEDINYSREDLAAMVGGLQNWGCLLSEDQLNRVEKMCESLNLEEASVGTDNIKNTSVRVTKTGFFSRIEHKEMYKLVQTIIDKINESKYGYDLSGISNIQLSVYEKGSKYEWHTDSIPQTVNNMYDLKISGVLILSSSDEYEGGALELFAGVATKLDSLSRGDLVTFPSYMLHKVHEITKGVRVSIVFWAKGPRFR